jgi:predicted nuclease with TOPRIM domain
MKSKIKTNSHVRDFQPNQRRHRRFLEGSGRVHRKTKTIQQPIKHTTTMNKQNRRDLQGYVDSLEEIKSCLETMQEDETEKLDNMPEGLQESERGEAMQEAIDNLESAASSLEEAIDYLNEIIGG